MIIPLWPGPAPFILYCGFLPAPDTAHCSLFTGPVIISDSVQSRGLKNLVGQEIGRLLIEISRQLV